MRLRAGLVFGSFRYEEKCRNAQNSVDESMIEIGSVNTHAIIRLRTVAHWRPDLLAHIVPATPDDSTCVMLAGRLK